jgi:uncharacterized YigZ family protein
MQPYQTVAEYAEQEFVERKSRFIGQIFPVQTEEDALAFVEQTRKKHRDAAHNVYAYLLRDGGIKRYSDDGEPQGTGGMPALQVLERGGLTDVLVVVTRYFGGILLGAGGLVRAYSTGAKIALEAATKIWMRPCKELTIAYDYGFHGKMSHILPDFGAKTLDCSFSQLVLLKILLRSEQVPPFIQKITELSAGSVVPTVTDERFDRAE